MAKNFSSPHHTQDLGSDDHTVDEDLYGPHTWNIQGGATMDAVEIAEQDQAGMPPLVLADRYVLRHAIGSGTYGQVYAAFDQHRDRQVAIKLLRPSRTASLIQFKNEFRAISELHHRNLVRVHNLGRERDTWFIVMELIDGLPFFFHIQQHEHNPLHDDNTPSPTRVATPISDAATMAIPHAAVIHGTDLEHGTPAWQIDMPPSLPVDELNHRMVQLTEGILALHRAHIIHCDLKPSNVLVTSDGRVVILDFGVSRFIRQHGDASIAPRGYMGTPFYMPPEAWASHPPAPGFDWYAVGMMLAQILSGHSPSVLQKSARSLLQHNFEQAAIAYPAYAPLMQLAVQLLAPDPDERADHRDIFACCGAQNSDATTDHRDVPVPSFVDEHAMAFLETAWDDYLAGQDLTVVLEGAPGMGKNAICKAFLDQRIQTDAQAPWILTAKCKRNELVGYRAFDELMDGIASIMHTLPQPIQHTLAPFCTAGLCRLFPALLPFHNMRDEATGSDDPLPPPPIVAFEELLAALTHEHPILLWIEDIDEADQDSLRWLAHLFSPGARPHCFVLLSKKSQPLLSRDTFDIDTLGYAIRRYAFHPLNDDQALFWMTQWLPTSIARNARWQQQILAYSQGRPAWLRTACRIAAMPGATLDDLIPRDVPDFDDNQLPDNEQLVLDIASLSFDKPTFRIFRTLTHLSASELNLVLDRLTDENLLIQHLSSVTRGNHAYEEEQYELGDSHMRDLLHQNIPPSRVLDVHKRFVAAAKEGSIELSPTAMCAHLIGAKHYQEAQQYAHELIDIFEDAAAWNGASHIYRYLLHIDGVLTQNQDTSLQLRAAEAFIRAGYLHDAADIFATLADQHTSRRNAHHLHQRAASLYTMSGQHELAAQHLKMSHTSAITVLRVQPPTIARMAWFYLRTTKRVRELNIESLIDAPLSERERETLRNYRQAGLDLGFIDIVRGMEMGLQELHYVLDLRRPSPIAQTLSFLITFISAAGPRQRVVAQQWADVAFQLAHLTHDEDMLALAQVGQASIDYHKGDYISGWEKIRDSYTRLRRYPPNDPIRYYTEMHLVYTAHMVGDIDALRHAYYSQLIEARSQHNLIMEAAVTFPGFVTWLLDDAPEAGLSALERVRIPAEKRSFFRLSDFFDQQYRAEVSLYRKEWDALNAHIAKLAHYDRTVSAWVMELPRQAARFLRGRLMIAQAARSGRLSPSIDTAIQGMAGSMIGSEDLLIQSWGYILRCGLAVIKGRRILAAARLEQAIISLETGGITLYAETARAAGQASGLLPSPADPYGILRDVGMANPERFVETYHPYVLFHTSQH